MLKFVSKTQPAKFDADVTNASIFYWSKQFPGSVGVAAISKIFLTEIVEHLSQSWRRISADFSNYLNDLSSAINMYVSSSDLRL